MRKKLCKIWVQVIALILVTVSLTGCNSYERKKIYEATESKDVMIGLWSTPAKHAVMDQASMDARCKEMYDLGARMLITLEEQWDLEYMNRLLDGAEKQNMKVLIHTFGKIDLITPVIEATKSHPAVIGYYLKDEPLPDDYPELNDLFSQVKKLVPDDFLLVGNLLPDYGASMYGQGDYVKYISSFYETVPDANAVFFDSYIYMTTGADVNSLLYTFATNRTVADEKSVGLYPILQAAGWGTQKTPTVGDLRFQANLALLFGSEGFIWYYYWIPYDIEEYLSQYAMVTYEGEKTDQWYAVQTVNQEIHKMKGVFLDYEFQGVVQHNLQYIINPFRRTDYELSEYKELKEIEGDGEILVGCFEKDGKTGLYVMNISSSEASSAVLKLDGTHDYQIWGADGLEILDRGSEISLDFEYGEGCFIMID